MSATRVIIGGIILIQAFFLLYSPVQRYNFHNFFELIKKNLDCECLSNWGYKCIQQVRYVLVALMLAGVYSVTFKSNVWVAFLAQLVWIFTQSQLLYGFDLLKLNSQLLNILVQILILINILREVNKQFKQYTKCGNKTKIQTCTQQVKQKVEQPIKQQKEQKEQKAPLKKQKSQQLVPQNKQFKNNKVQQTPKNVNQQQGKKSGKRKNK